MVNVSDRVTVVGSVLLLAVLSSGACSTPTSERQSPSPQLLAEMTPVVSVKELMAHMIDPASDNIFEAVWWDGTADGLVAHRPQTDEDWERVKSGAVTLVEGIELLKIPRLLAPAGDVNDSLGPSPPELSPTQIKAKIDSDTVLWTAKIQALRNVGLAVLDVVKNKDVDALWEASGNLDQACESCHLEYWYPSAKAAALAKTKAGARFEGQGAPKPQSAGGP